MAVAINEKTPAPLSHFQPMWHRAAPRRVVEKYRGNDPLGGWTAWQKYLARRSKPAIPPFLAGKEPPLGWGLSPEWDARPAGEFLDADALLDSPLADRLAHGTLDVPESLQVLGLAYRLPDRAAKLPADSWWQLAERLHDLSVDAQQQRVDWLADPLDFVRQQLLAAELPLALSYLFPEIRALHALRKSARSSFSEAMIEVTDGQGLPHARLLPVLGLLFACWTRARWMGARLVRCPWSRDAEYQYQWLVRHAIRLADEGGRFAITPLLDPLRLGKEDGRGAGPAPSGWSKYLFSMALDLAGDDGDCAAATAALPGVVPKHIKFNADALPDASLNSDWSGITVISNGWSRSSVRLAVSYADDPVHLELRANGERLIAGAWTFETTCDGDPVCVVGEWEELCWLSDKHCDFLELAVELSQGLRLERQLLFGRQDCVLYAADIVVSTTGQPRRLRHSSHLPLTERAEWRPQPDTRDGLLLGRNRGVAVMPLALPEWRADPRGGTLSEDNGRLVLTQESMGHAMCCPLFLDLKPSRAKKERTWRQLTVAEWMEVVPRDVAVGFRAQSGRGQWLIYRSLGPAGNRTLLGQNIAGEFCAGRFHASGQFDNWLEIESS